MTLLSLTLLALLTTAGNPQAPQASGQDRIGVRELRTHYAAAEAELRVVAQDHLTAEQREQRSAMLDVLNAYAGRADFGLANDPVNRRALRFVDQDGRRCAVAELLHASGRDDLVQQVALSHNDAFVAELATSAPFNAWLGEVGLTLEEAARIQGPARGTGWGRGGGAGGTPSRPVTGGAMGSPGSPISPDMQTLFRADWWSWWEFAKVGFLSEGRSPVAQMDDSARTRSESRRASVARRVLPTLRAGLADSNATVRAAAAVSYGRVAGAQALPDLRALLDDASSGVREAALLAMGATGSEEAVHLLLSIAHARDVEGLDTWRETEEVAVLALALLRTRGAATGVAGMLPRGAGTMAEAVFLHGALAPSARLATRAREQSGLFDGRKKARYSRKGDFADALAVEALREDEGEEILTALLRASSERDIERRRSAVTSLGALHDQRANGPLRTAFETESDPVARGLALIALANSPAPGTDEFLAKILKRGRSLDRPWAALALGILAREHENAAAPKALRTALKLERNRDNRRAIALALGIARDRTAVPDLVLRIQETRDHGSRVAYAYALGLIGDPAAGPVLRATMEVEHFALQRAEMAQALALLHLDEDLPDLVRSLEKANDPDAAVQSAAAFAFHGSTVAVPQLVTASETAKSPQARAAAFLAIGLLLDPGPIFSIAGELRDRNPFVTPEWFLRATQTTL